MDMTAVTGPRLTDEEFFGEHLNTDRPGLAGVAEAARRGDYAEARTIFAADVRASLRVDEFLKIRRALATGPHMLPGEDLASACERVLNGTFVSTGTPITYEGEIDWFANPTFNQYREWTWQLNRHVEWAWLGKRYLETGEERFVEGLVSLFRSWVHNTAVEPLDAPSSATKAWRTIETGIRMGGPWQWALHSVIQSPTFTDDVLVDWCKSVFEHGWRLRNVHHSHNWLIMEQNGLAQIGIIYPQFKQAEEWRTFAFNTLIDELDNQTHPDGMQYELSTGYHQVNINNYQWLWDVAEAYGFEVPTEFADGLERMHEVNIKLMMPDRRLPDLNDGKWLDTAPLFERATELYPHRSDFRWAATGGREGAPPSYRSIGLEYAGLYVMRADWDDQAVYGLFDGGPFGFAHQHEDKLNLIVHAYGALLLTEAGNYAYDSSEMRRYVLSTRGHNTIRIDGSDQNRRSTWPTMRERVDIHAPCGALWDSTPEYDVAEAVYDEGYGEDAELRADHRRTVVFLKRGLPGLDREAGGAGGLPCFLVIDRLTPRQSGKHEFEVLWHLATASPDVHGTRVEGRASADGSTNSPGIAVVTGSVPNNTMEVVSGQEEPEWQGWRSVGSHQQGEYEATPTIVHRGTLHGPLRVVTIVMPLPPKVRNPLESLHASGDTEDTDVNIRLSDGTEVSIDERDFAKRASGRV